MEYVNLGSTGCKVSRFCLGTMMFGGKTDQEESIRITRTAVDAGVNFIDTADVYTETRCETILGEALEGIRDQVVLASKVGMKVGEGPNDTGISRYHYVRAVEASLKRLRTDRIDVYYVHWPATRMNLEEMMRALDDLVRSGKILYPACSNFPAWLVMKSQWVADLRNCAPLVCGQYPYNLIERGIEVEILPMARSLNFGITIYRPIAIGVLTGKYLETTTPAGTRAEQDDRIDRWMRKYGSGVRRLVEFARARGHTATAAANAWCLSTPGVTSVILGVSRLSQLQDNLRGFDLKLNPQERDELSSYFDTDVKEEAGGQFPTWRRRADIL
ncbi:MAG: aldo/keto reductase [Phycisphaerae bacterium]|jgi:aryl-alcohol dehydrogenase-like predicted oxidoreductase|nr:MAG: aldo/keto reductase [Phycisphaerae bacterium]